MTELTISRLTATLHFVDGFHDAERRVDRMLRHVAEHRLDTQLAHHPLPDGEWCVRRIAVSVTLDPDAHEATTESDWADALLDSLEQTLRTQPSNEVVRYRHRRDALTELVRSVATGSIEHTWAWRQLGLLEASDPSPESDPGGAIVAAARRAPEEALHAVLAAVRDAGLAPLHRVLGTAGWLALATIVAGAAGITDVVELMQEARPMLEETEDSEPPTTQRARVVLAASSIASAIVHSALRPHGAGPAWAVLVIAEADPASLHGPLGARLVAQVSRVFETQPATRDAGLVTRHPPKIVKDIPSTIASRADVADDVEAAIAVSTPAETRGRVTEDRTRSHDENETDGDGDGDGQLALHGSPSVWCGVFFLLATAAEAAMPDRVFADPRLESRSMRWVMHQLAQLLAPMAPTDPASLAFAGLPPDAEPPAGPIASPAERLALEDVAAAWVAATVLRLAPSARVGGSGDGEVDGSARVEQIARRRGEISGEGGWTDVSLRLDDVDVDVRLAGLDVDPGWVPWLGVVVRFVYE